MPAPILFELTLAGYCPPSQNALKGSHWSAMNREKKRALHALRSALESSPGDQLIGTMPHPESNTFRMALSLLESYLMITTGSCAVGSSVTRSTRKKKSAPKSK